MGDPLARFAEDGLRPLRACRFAAQLGFELEPATLAAIPERLEVARKVSVERVFAEVTKLLCGREPAQGLRLLERTGLLDLWLPELRPLVGCTQNRHHRLDVWEHTLATFQAEKTLRSDLRWALLLHDAGKPGTRTVDADGEAHFYGHEEVSAGLAVEILTRLRAPNQLRDKVQGPDPAPRRASGAGRERYGLPAAPEAAAGSGCDAGGMAALPPGGPVRQGLAGLRAPPRWQGGRGLVGGGPGGMGKRSWPGSRPFASRGMTAKELALDGNALMALAGRPGGPWLGELQKHLLEAVLEEPTRNTAEELRALASAWLAALA